MMNPPTTAIATAFSRLTLRGGFVRSLRAASSFPTTTTDMSFSNINTRIGLCHPVRSPVCQSGVSSRRLSTTSSSSSDTTSLSKLLSTCTNYSRRELDRLIQTGEVTVKGKCVEQPRISMEEMKDIQKGGVVVKVKGKPVVVGKSLPTVKVWAVNKLVGEVVGENDPQNRPSMLDRLKRGGVGKNDGHLKAVGRLDIPTEGLILVTNNGKFARELELPKNQIHRVYRVRVHGALTENKLLRIRNGFAGFQPMKVQVERQHRNTKNSTNTWVQVTATEGQNRQIRRVFQELGMSVTRLIRIAYGDYQLHTIPPGLAIPVPYKPVETQKRKGPLFQKRKTYDKPKKEPTASVSWVSGYQPL